MTEPIVMENARNRNIILGSTPRALDIVQAIGGPINAIVSFSETATSNPKRREEASISDLLVLNNDMNLPARYANSPDLLARLDILNISIKNKITSRSITLLSLSIPTSPDMTVTKAVKFIILQTGVLGLLLLTISEARRKATITPPTINLKPAATLH
jgi:hypothetical protein